ncbi:hypothetical protein K0M31_007501 [Melipona bicolor]|uniref:Uncharacterized protein n=1 Tax=Melipona bicolor TaxID=60889 RepID=A0AA40GCY8_9HYME|nr:hypothetical protein K0M31_007501 [Melipona bicolor]
MRMIGCSLNELKQLIQKKKKRPDQKAKHQTKTNKPPKEEKASKRGERIKAYDRCGFDSLITRQTQPAQEKEAP